MVRPALVVLAAIALLFGAALVFANRSSGPTVSTDVSDDRGTRVEAPGTKVETGADGTRVQAPGVDITIPKARNGD